MKFSILLILLLGLTCSQALSQDMKVVPSNNKTAWTKCIGNEIGRCLSCVLEAAAHAVDAVISACDGAVLETVAAVLETTKTALECISPCKAASTKLVARQCTSWYCQTDFCVKCCGAGRWQCMGTDFTPQCAPVLPAVEKSWLPVHPAKPEEAKNATIAKCRCGSGSGNPDSCCSRCQSSKDKHNVPHCAGGGKNTGPFCGNDFHVTEPNACYGEKPVCCTNDMNMPICCFANQTCHSPLVGDNSCRGG
eukprot:NODE_1488_length_933_cov_94.487557_g1153_i0.p1 GENE.NODE_1488_length_933_cov_94.487557_g1153_i0~~NODE_1488_length_933_cov_94.487557_g1153_i0.p1  ORF type:complete len:250 (-),score=38.11 NODE_1488_length_933_cov_94.487557_g1153_i0:131-880(-)